MRRRYDVACRVGYDFFNDIIYIENFTLSNIKIDEKSYKTILIYYIGYVTIKKDLEIYNVNPLYLIFSKVNGYFEEINRNKYQTVVPANEQRKNKKYTELWIKIRDLIRSITKNVDDYDEKCMKVKFNSDDNLPLNKTIENLIVTKVVRAVLHENNKYYPQVFLDECLYKIQKCYAMTELTFLKELMLIKQVHQKSVMFVTSGIS